MDLNEHFHQALESLADHPRRVIASATGVFWGAAALVLMLAWGTGFREFMRAEMGRFGRACLFAGPGVTSSGFPGYRSGVHVRFARADIAAAEQASREAVEAIVPETISYERVLAEAGGRVRRLDLTATDERFAAYRNFRLARGRSFDAVDMELRRPVAVIGYEAAEALFGVAESALGKSMRINGHSFEIIGVAERKGRQYINTNRPDNRLAVVPITTAEAVLGFDEKAVTRLLIYLRPGVAPKRALRSVLASLGPRSGLHPDDLDAVWWFDTSWVTSISDLFYVGFMLFMGVAGSVTLLIGAVGIANYQLATLAERTVEIAVARAIGARSRVLVVQTVIESLLVSGAAVLLGVLLGLVGCAALARLPPVGMFPAPIISAVTIGVTAIASLGVAVTAAVVPALRVRRLDIATALRAGT